MYKNTKNVTLTSYLSKVLWDYLEKYNLDEYVGLDSQSVG